ncbi:putative reverse transcriptase domain-containing protein, partial [Tanacetum coccineum]
AMAISVISISSDSYKDSVGTPVGRVILFGTIPTTIPDTTPVITPPTTQTDTTVIPTEITIITPNIPPLPTILPFLSSADDTTDSDTPDTPPSPTHGTPFTYTTLFTQRSPTASSALRHRIMVLAPGQPILHGRPYRYHLNELVHMITARKRVEPLPTHHLAVRHSINYSSSNHFSSDDSSSDSSSSSLSETSSDSPADALSDSTSSRSSSDHSLPASPSGMRSSHRLCSLVPSVHHSSAIFERPSYNSSFASRSRKRSRSLVVSVPRFGLEFDFEDESSEPSRSRGALHYYLGIEFLRNSNGIVITQRKYASDLIEYANLQNEKPSKTPLDPRIKLTYTEGEPLQDPSHYKTLVGKLICLTISRLDLAFAAHLLSQFSQQPYTSHLQALHRVIKIMLTKFQVQVYSYKEIIH